jgi:hypothetical protein
MHRSKEAGATSDPAWWLLLRLILRCCGVEHLARDIGFGKALRFHAAVRPFVIGVCCRRVQNSTLSPPVTVSATCIRR